MWMLLKSAVGWTAQDKGMLLPTGKGAWNKKISVGLSHHLFPQETSPESGTAQGVLSWCAQAVSPENGDMEVAQKKRSIGSSGAAR